MKSNKIILLTGASGFIGRHLIKPLVNLGFTVHAVCRHPLEDSAVVWHAIDLFDHKKIRSLLKTIQPTHLLHTAWFAKPGEYWESPLNTDWVNASLELAQAFINVGGKRFVGLGTCAEYDWCANNKSPLREIDPVKPTTRYGKSKLELFEKLSTFFSANKISFAWARLFYPFGPFESRERLVPSICLALLNNQFANCTSGEQIRDFIYVEEAARAIAELTDSNYEEAYNIGSGTGITVAEIATTLAELMQKPHLLKLGGLKPAKIEPEYIVADMNKMRETVGFMPQKTMKEDLQATINWWKQQR